MKKLKIQATIIMCMALVLMLNLKSNAQTQKGQDIDGEAASDQSGISVSMPDGNTVAIGAHRNDGSTSDAGHVRIYTWNGSAWVQEGADIDGEVGNACQSGFSVSMPDANTVGIGAFGNDDNGGNSGSTRIYEWNGSAWIQKGQDLDGELHDDMSGYCVSMPDANTVAIGAPYNSGNGNDAGHVRIYSWNGTAWTQKGIDLDGEAAGDESGNTVSMPDANTVAIGSHLNDGNGLYSGQVRVYTWNGSAWVKKGMDIDGLATNDGMGYCVSMPDANTVGFGAPFYGGIGNNPGRARVYMWNGSTWVQKGTDIIGENVFDMAGQRVSMPDNNTIAVGASFNNGNGFRAGHVRIYSWNGSAWVQTGTDIDGEAADDWSGEALSMPDAGTVAIGASANDGNGQSSGHVRVYSVPSVGIQENDFGNKLVVSPNPGDGKFLVQLGGSCESITVIVRNMMGQELIRNTFNQISKFEINIPGDAGVYFMEVITENKRLPLKVIKS